MWKNKPRSNKNLRYSIRLVDYYERDSLYSWWKHLPTPLYCQTCNSINCSDNNHIKNWLSPVIRIPKKNASKYKMKKFNQFLEKEFSHLMK